MSARKLACDGCRKSKVRCDGQEGVYTCSRCAKKAIDCTWDTPRSKRGRKSHNNRLNTESGMGLFCLTPKNLIELNYTSSNHTRSASPAGGSGGSGDSHSHSPLMTPEHSNYHHSPQQPQIHQQVPQQQKKHPQHHQQALYHLNYNLNHPVTPPHHPHQRPGVIGQPQHQFPHQEENWQLPLPLHQRERFLKPKSTSLEGLPSLHKIHLLSPRSQRPRSLDMIDLGANSSSSNTTNTNTTSTTTSPSPPTALHHPHHHHPLTPTSSFISLHSFQPPAPPSSPLISASSSSPFPLNLSGDDNLESGRDMDMEYSDQLPTPTSSVSQPIFNININNGLLQTASAGPLTGTPPLSRKANLLSPQPLQHHPLQIPQPQFPLELNPTPSNSPANPRHHMIINIGHHHHHHHPTHQPPPITTTPPLTTTPTFGSHPNTDDDDDDEDNTPPSPSPPPTLLSQDEAVRKKCSIEALINTDQDEDNYMFMKYPSRK